MDYPGKVITKTQVTPTQTSASGNWTLDDQAAAIKNNNWPVALVPNPISKSLRFNSADSAYLNRTPASAGNRDTWTYSAWIKRSVLSTNQTFFSARSDGSNYDYCSFNTSDQFSWAIVSGGSTVGRLITTQVFRDVSSWYHFLITYDSGNATGGNRMRFYVNGTEVTAFGTDTNPSQNQDGNINNTIAHNIGRFGDGTEYCNYYQTETNFIDGQALTPSDFGLTNPQTGQWIPKKYTGTYGTNGFYLNFKDATSTTTLGYDYSGNANNWTTNNFSVTAGAGNDSLTDVPTPWVAYNTTGDVGGVIRGNYATFNALQLGSSTTLNNGNLDSAATASSFNTVIGTMFASSGKWYAEVTVLDVSADYSTKRVGVGVIKDTGTEQSSYLGSSTSGYGYYANATRFNNATSASYGATYVTNDVIGIAMDLDAGTLVFYKNNTSQGTAYSGLSGAFSFAASHYGSGAKVAINFGQRPFAYTPPTGFRSLCTTNLPATAIGFGLTNQGNNYFDATLYTGTGSALSVTNSGSMQPDFVWLKRRSSGNSHGLFDSIRGVNNYLSSETTGAEATIANSMTAFNSNGFSLGTDSTWNLNTSTNVGWQWKAGGTGVTNTAGSITSTVSANTTAGFSVVTYTGNGSTGTVGHGLGVAPSMMIVKQRGSAGTNWAVYHASLPSAFSVAGTQVMYLNATTANTQDFDVWNSNNTEANRFSIGASTLSNANGGTYVAYCFAAVPGYSAFGSYTGNGSTDGPFVYLGFRPRYVMVKRTDTTASWAVVDTARDPYNATDKGLIPNTSDAEGTGYTLDYLSNGFKMRLTGTAYNASGGTYIYAAFAESPFQFANAR